MASDFFGIRVGPKKCLGVDIGTSFIKIVELSQHGKRRKLDNYGEMEAVSLFDKPFRTFEKSTLTVSNPDVVKSITAILTEAKIETKDVYFSIPDFSTFFTAFRLPSMSKEELPQAIQYEARQHIPLPLSEVVLDWQIISQKTINHKLSDFSVLLVAVPNEVINQYQEIAKLAKLNVVALEAEVFSLARAINNGKKDTVMLIDLGARSTTISIIDLGLVKISHSFDTSGNDFTNLISKGLNLEMAEAEKVKKEQGLLRSNNASVREAILPMIDLIASEIKKISQNFYSQEGKRPQKIILAGGTALLPGLADYFSETAGIPAEIANPFSDLFYPPILNDVLKEIGPAYAVAVGAAMRGLE
ncbi:MAG: type IV pilus assembly protein PilM [Candidatus Nealsonbacteria bacterium]|nr:type IV pilus assembly protein PilM [Candidatus Nealsonbacteria bacterium]